ncbi:MAG: dephospho-CoA kinase [Flavobacteriales bacterium]|nr:dephospho-CoA kinase [Flavobacteriales bacterium]
MKYTVGLTGGIGSGKTTFATMLEKKGAAVYYADQRAKELMNDDHMLVENIKDIFGTEAYRGGQLDRTYIAEKIFFDKKLLTALNAIVHPAVYMDFEHWRLCQNEAPYVVLESAILFESKGDRRCDVTVTVSIPLELRIQRTVERDHTDSSAVRARIASQMSDNEREALADITVQASTFEGKEAEAIRLDAFFRAEAAKAE